MGDRERISPREAEFGPLQLLTVVFDGNRFKGEILPELERLKEARIVRLIDLLVVRKDRSGAITVLTASDLEWEEATQFGAYLGTIVGLGSGGVGGAERGAIAGAAELADGHLFDADDVERLKSSIPSGSTVALALIEHLWALPLLGAITRADGYELSNQWVNIDDLVEIGLAQARATATDTELDH
jgi:uncharacterized membrane protein